MHNIIYKNKMGGKSSKATENNQDIQNQLKNYLTNNIWTNVNNINKTITDQLNKWVQNVVWKNTTSDMIKTWVAQWQSIENIKIWGSQNTKIDVSQWLW